MTEEEAALETVAPAAAPERPRSAGTFAAFAHRNYRLWFGGQLISLAGTWMQIIAQGWLVYDISKSEFALGVVGFASAIPNLLLAPWGGVIADRFPKRTLLIITQTASMLLAFVLSALAFAGVVQVWHVVLLATLLGVVSAVDAPTRQAFTVEMVGRGDLTNAIALNSIMFNGARVIGPALGGLLLAAVGAAWCFLFNGVSFLAVIVGLVMMRITVPQPVLSTQKAMDLLKEGVRYTRSHPHILGVLALASIFGLFGQSYSALLPAFVDQVYHGGPDAYGWINTAVGLGAIVGGYLIARVAERAHRGRWLFASNMGFSSLLFIFSFITALPLALVGGLGLGLCFMVQNTTMNTILQTKVDDAMRGRVLALYTLTFFGFAPFGNLLAGAVAQVWSLQGTVTVAAVITLVLSALVFIRFPDTRKVG